MAVPAQPVLMTAEERGGRIARFSVWGEAAVSVNSVEERGRRVPNSSHASRNVWKIV